MLSPLSAIASTYLSCCSFIGFRYAALDLLLANKGRVVSRGELRRTLWPDSRVVMFEASIAAVIRELRRALRDDPRAPRFIETVPKRGYRFLAPTEAGDTPRAAATQSTFPHGKRGGFLRISAAVFLALVGALASDTGIDRWPSRRAGASNGSTATVTAVRDLRQAALGGEVTPPRCAAAIAGRAAGRG